jgi:hypothetical protein
MDIDEGAGAWEIKEDGSSLRRLPKSVRFLGELRPDADRSAEFSGGEFSAGMYEFEVVKGNAAYRAGERFYLTPGEAHRIYRAAEKA